MDIRFFSRDPAFPTSGYVEKGTIGYDGKGWYFFNGGQLYGPYGSQEEAKQKEQSNEHSQGESRNGREYH